MKTEAQCASVLISAALLLATACGDANPSATSDGGDGDDLRPDTSGANAGRSESNAGSDGDPTHAANTADDGGASASGAERGENGAGNDGDPTHAANTAGDGGASATGVARGENDAGSDPTHGANTAGDGGASDGAECKPGSEPLDPPEQGCRTCSIGEYCAGGGAAAQLCGDGSWDHDADPSTDCMPYANCEPGTGIALAGDHKCTACEEGRYNDASAASACKPWATCEGRILAAAGTATSDRVCGAELWTRQLGTANLDRAAGVGVDAMGNVVIAGVFGEDDTSYGYTYVRKYDNAGTELWTQESHAGDLSQAMAVGSNGHIAVTGVTLEALPGGTLRGINDTFVRSYDSDGSVLWTRQFGSDGNEYGRGLAVDREGNVIVSGYTFGTLDGQTSQGSGDVFVRKYDAAGTELWTRQFGTTDADYGSALAVDAMGNIVVAGSTYGTLTGGQSSGDTIDGYVRKYDPAGKELWTRQFGAADDDGCSAVAVDAAGNIGVGCNTRGGIDGYATRGESDALVRVYDSAGNELWTDQFGSVSYDGCSGIATDGMGNFIVTGSSGGAFADEDQVSGVGGFFVRIYSTAGEVRWTKHAKARGYNTDVAVDAPGNIFVAGEIDGLFGPEQTQIGEQDVFVTVLREGQ